MARHTSKEIQAVIDYALAKGWRLEKRTGHVWGRLLCPGGPACCGGVTIGSTPQNPENAAKRLRRLIDRCPR